MKVGDGEGSKSLVVLGRDPVFQEGHVFLLKEVEGDAIVFNILDMAVDGDKASLHFFLRLRCFYLVLYKF